MKQSWAKRYEVLTSFSSRGVVVKTGRDECASTGSTKNIASNVSALRVAIDHNVGAGALGLEGSNLRDTVAGSLGNLVAVISAKGVVELDIDVVTGLALGGELAAGRLNEGEGAAIMVRRIVAASHEDDCISAWCVELGGSSLGGCEGGESAQGDGVADAERHDYVLRYVCRCIMANKYGDRYIKNECKGP
jgi:hypothetical protein